MDRDRDRRYDDRDRARPDTGESYRPSAYAARSSSPRADSYRSHRDPPYLRGRTPPAADSYTPGHDRRARPHPRSPGPVRPRSRSPAFRHRDRSPAATSWRPQPRSPPPRWSPRRDTFGRDERPRSPPRSRPRSRSPYRGSGARSPRGARMRSPLGLKRGRDASQGPRGRRSSPPPAKRERILSPAHASYDRPRSPRRPYSPPRDLRRSPPNAPRGSWRPRSRSPRRDERPPPTNGGMRVRSPSPSTRPSHHSSGNTSRRSSPPIHPSRLAFREEAVPEHRPDDRSHRNDSRPYERSAAQSGRRSPPEPTSYRERSPFDGSGSYRANDGYPRDDYRSSQRMQEPNGHGYRNGSSGDSRRAPSGEEMMSRNGNSTTAPPSMSAHNRPGSVSVLSAPTQPRGGPGPPPRRDNPYPTPPSSGFRRGPAPHHPPPIHPRGSQAGPPSGTPSLDSPGPSSGGIPTGPRSSHAPSGHHHHHPHHPSSHGPAAAGAFRGSHNSSSRTYPLTQRFAHHLRDLPSVIPGGKLLPSGVPANVAEKLAKLEQDKKRLEQELMEKEEKLRGGLRTWERLERESARDGLRSELAEGQVGILSGESGMGGAAF